MAQFDVAAFKSTFSANGALQTNKYNVFITATSQLQNSFINNPTVSASFNSMGTDLQYRCIGATLPGMILRTADTNRYGTGVLEKMPFSSVYTDVDLTFICDRYGNAYNFWYAWLNFVFATVGRDASQIVDQTTQGRVFYTAQYKDNYTSIVNIVVYDNFGNAATQYYLYTAYPVSINDSPLSWGDNNNLLKLTVKMTFREWAINNGQVVLSQGQQQTASTSTTQTTVAP